MSLGRHNKYKRRLRRWLLEQTLRCQQRQQDRHQHKTFKYNRPLLCRCLRCLRCLRTDNSMARRGTWRRRRRLYQMMIRRMTPRTAGQARSLVCPALWHMRPCQFLRLSLHLHRVFRRLQRPYAQAAEPRGRLRRK
eukprot:Mycagemm_TRINITY_DN9716_c0_g2::TRINITY_DN9716_c0_g2_i1::g.4905::m.4905 type:complete len:136 gc:universal TRINITY_DN9716_c0_g2_i1:606-199(-)